MSKAAVLPAMAFDADDAFSFQRPTATSFHERLAQTRRRAYVERWDIDPRIGATSRDRRVTLWAIGCLPREEADAKDRRMLHFIEGSLDGYRQQCCTATIPTIADRVALSVSQVRQRLDALTGRQRIRRVRLTSGREGYRVGLWSNEREAADRELRAMWRRTPEYSDWLCEAMLPTRFENELRLLWTREIWRSGLPGFVKSAAIELSQFVDRTGDAPFCRVTYATLARRTAYSTERMLQAVNLLRHNRWIHVTSFLGRGDRGAGLEVRLRLQNLDAVLDCYRPSAFIVPNHQPPEVGTKNPNAVAAVTVASR